MTDLTARLPAIGGGAIGKFLPIANLHASQLYIKGNIATDYDSRDSNFFLTFVDSMLTHPDTGLYPRQKGLATSNSPVTIDINDTGVLTSVVSPSLGASNLMEVKITKDGDKVYSLNQLTQGSGRRFTLGALGYGSSELASTGIGLGSTKDGGYGAPLYMLPTPPQALSLGWGLRFETSLKIEFISVNGATWDSTTSNAEWAVGYSRIMPVEFEG